MSITIQGMERVLEALQELGETDGYEERLGECCAIVERAAKKKAPKDTGELRRSIQSRVDNTGDAIQGIVFTPLEYAPYVEFGTGIFAENGGRMDVPWNYKDDKGEWHSTSGQKPQPFMRPALLENREKIMRKLTQGVKKDA